MYDAFAGACPELESPASFAMAIVPSNSADLTHIPRALYCLSAGTVKVTMKSGGDPVIFPILPGTPLPVRVTRVWATDTTATGIVGVW